MTIPHLPPTKFAAPRKKLIFWSLRKPVPERVLMIWLG